MKKTYLSLLFVLCLFVPLTASAQTVAELVQKNTEAKGGEEKIRSIHSMIQQGSSTMMGMEIPVSLYQKRPNKMRREMTMQGMAIVVGYDGKTAWMVNPMAGPTPQELPEDQAKQTRYQADLDGLFLDYEQKGYTLEYLGEGEVRGKKAYKIQAGLPGGDALVVYLDADTYLETRIDAEVNNPDLGGRVTVESYMSDYRDVDGVPVPFSYEVVMNGQTFQKITFSEISFNTEVPDSLFAFPGK